MLTQMALCSRGMLADPEGAGKKNAEFNKSHSLLTSRIDGVINFHRPCHQNEGEVPNMTRIFLRKAFRPYTQHMETHMSMATTMGHQAAT